MTEWGVVGVLAAVVGLIVTVAGPMIKGSSNLTKISTILDSVTDRLNKLEVADKDFQESARQAHSRIHGRIDAVEDMVNDHEVRITTIEKTAGGQP